MNDLKKYGVFLAFLCICGADPVPLEQLQLPPGFTVNIFTKSTPKARSLAVSGGDKSIVYISNDLLVSVLSRPTLLLPFDPSLTSISKALTRLSLPMKLFLCFQGIT